MSPLFAPSADRPEPRPPATPDPRAVAEAWSEAYAAADLESLARLYAGDARLAVGGVARHLHGLPAIRREMQRRWTAYRAAGAAAGCRGRRIVGDERRAVLEWSDPLGLPYCSVFDCRGGLIVAQRDYVDARDRERLYD